MTHPVVYQLPFTASDKPRCLNMKILVFALLALSAPVAVSAQQGLSDSRTGAGAPSSSEMSSLPLVRIGNNDLIGITVYDAPELTRTVRVSAEGDIRMPMVKQSIHAAGLYPAELEKAIVAALTGENVLVDPVVTVSIVEYLSRPITVVGEVKIPTTFQAIGDVTLLDAISRAQGFTENAGSEILVSRQEPGSDGKSTTLFQRIPVRSLLNGLDPSLNIHLHGGEEIRVPEAGRVYVVGQVKKAGPYYINDGSESSVLKAIANSDGLDEHPGHIAYIYRQEGGAGGRNEIRVELKKILDRKTPDVALEANDILYIPKSTGRATAIRIGEILVPVATALTVVMLNIYRP
jgi:polysaccharide export outer membrane protein